MKRTQMLWPAATMLIAVLLVGLALAMLNAGQATGQTTIGKPKSQPTYTLLSPTRLVSGTLYTSSPRRDASGLDMSDTNLYAGADVFVSAAMEEGASLVAQVELSPDRVNWVPVRYETTGYNDDGETVVRTLPPLQRELAYDGSAAEYFMIVLAGQYLRVRLDATGVTTPSVRVTYRDYPQWP